MLTEQERNIADEARLSCANQFHGSRECLYAACEAVRDHALAQLQEQADDELVKRIQYAIAQAYRDVKGATSTHAAEVACAVLRIALEDLRLVRLEDVEKAVRDELQQRGYAPWDEAAFAVCSRLTASKPMEEAEEDAKWLQTFIDTTAEGRCKKSLLNIQQREKKALADLKEKENAK